MQGRRFCVASCKLSQEIPGKNADLLLLLPSPISHTKNYRADKLFSESLENLGEEFAGPEKAQLGLAPKVPQNVLGAAEPFFNKLFAIR